MCLVDTSGIYIHLGLLVTTTKCCDYVSGVIIWESAFSHKCDHVYCLLYVLSCACVCVCVDVGGIDQRSAMVSSSRGFLGMNYVDVVL